MCFLHCYRFDKWVQLSGHNELLDLPLKFLRSNMRFCELHFQSQEIFVGSKLKKLKRNTIPSKFHEGHTPLSEEEIGKWREMKHYGALHELNFIKETEVEDAVKSPPDSQADHISTPCSSAEAELVREETAGIPPKIMMQEDGPNFTSSGVGSAGEGKHTLSSRVICF